MNPSKKVFKPTPPLKGSFPLDHDGECKEFMKKFMVCLKENCHENYLCRLQSKEYLECRMKNGLMTVEEFSRLGLKDL